MDLGHAKLDWNDCEVLTERRLDDVHEMSSRGPDGAGPLGVASGDQSLRHGCQENPRDLRHDELQRSPHA